MTIHKEGYTTIALCILFIFVFNALIQFYMPQAHAFKWVVYILSFTLFVASLYLFRTPGINITTNEKVILSPADGIVVKIEEVQENDFFKDRRIQISIAISPIDVYVNRIPVNGIVKYLKYQDKDQTLADPQSTIAIENKTGLTILLRQVATTLGSRIAYYIKEGDRVEQGTQFGFIKFGSRVEILLPIGTKLNVELNQSVKAGQTIVAELKA